MNHSFNIEIATEHGLEEAIVLENIVFWIRKNIANQKNYYDGNYWTYNSVNAFQELFPYLTESKIRRTLLKLESVGLLMTGNYNKIAYDRTKWYALTDKAFELYGITICQNSKMESDKKTNQFIQNDVTIPDINTDIKPDVNTDKAKGFKKPTFSEVEQHLSDLKQQGKTINFTAETFYNFYESKGWVVGRNKMKNWQACVRTWISKSRPIKKQELSQEDKYKQFKKAIEGGGQ